MEPLLACLTATTPVIVSKRRVIMRAVELYNRA